MAKKAPKKQKVKQQHLDGMAPPSIKELDGAAENYYDSIRERLPYTQAEKEAKETLVGLMKKHQLTRYEFDDFVVTAHETTGVAVKKKKQPVGGDENETAPGDDATE